MNPHYNQSYTREQIVAVLREIQDCVRENRFTISMNGNRQENVDFMSKYNLTEKKRIAILQRIKPEDFCHTLPNTHPGYEHEILYVFCPQVELFNFDGNEEAVDIYTKFNIINNKGQWVVVISFHRLNKPIDYAFR